MCPMDNIFKYKELNNLATLNPVTWQSQPIKPLYLICFQYDTVLPNFAI